ncbi:MAG TPA: hypothetical protein VJG83_02920 [archaeon]|nr:hypothetical protein [archaeon]
MVFAFIPELLYLCSFPGIILNQIVKLVFCKLFEIEVYDYSLFRLKLPVGYVNYEFPKTLFQHLVIVLGPFFVQSILACALVILAYLARPDSLSLWFLCIWLSFSSGAHAIPDFSQTLDSLITRVKESLGKGDIIVAFLLPPIALIGILSIFKAFFSHLIDVTYWLLLLIVTIKIFNLV